ncbi:MAG: LPS translocon maturation chaperone LptM [Burkholderiaceae bacterium]
MRYVQIPNPNTFRLCEFFLRAFACRAPRARGLMLGVFLSSSLALSGCGQKGPLYMPRPEFPAPATSGAGAQPAPEASPAPKPVGPVQ